MGVRFRIEPKNQTVLPFIEVEKEPHSAFQQAKVPILPKTQEKYLALRSAEEIGLCIERANGYGEKQEKAGKPPNYGALYRTAIEEGWHTEQAEKKMVEEAKLAQKKAEATAKRKAAAEEKARRERDVAEREAILGRFRALTEAEQKALITAFLRDADPQARSGYKRSGFDSGFFLFPFIQFLKSTLL